MKTITNDKTGAPLATHAFWVTEIKEYQSLNPWRPVTRKSVNREFKSKQFLHLSENFKIWTETLGYNRYTVKNTGKNVDEFFSFLENKEIHKLKDIDNKHLGQYMEYLQHRPNCIKNGSLSTGYINKHITSLRLFSKYLRLTEKAGLIIKPELLKTTETATYLTKTEIKSLYGAAKNKENLYKQRDTAMLNIFYGCGLRSGEGRALNISDILFEKSLVYVRKGKNCTERYVPINKQAKQEIQEYILDQRNELSADKNNKALLLGRRGSRWTEGGIYHRLEWLRKHSGNNELQQKTFGMHILRHSIATHLLESGMKLEFISNFLGHKSLETTQKYTHLVNENNF